MGQFIAIWKPKGPTSHDIIDAVRRITGKQRVGHAGTLDPLAEGVLVIGVGREATKQLAQIVAKEKEYVATVRLGAVSTTDDSEGVIEVRMQNAECRITADDEPPLAPPWQGGDTTPPTEGEVQKALKQFIGTIEQVPPVYSAVKVQGRPAHRRVRQGQDVKLEPRTVEIKNIEFLSYTWPRAQLRVVTGPGVYIRSLARDLGEALGVGGYLEALTRTRVGQWGEGEALTLDAFAKKWNENAYV